MFNTIFKKEKIIQACNIITLIMPIRNEQKYVLRKSCLVTLSSAPNKCKPPVRTS